MAEVDFSNARIAPASGTIGGYSTGNPTRSSNVSFQGNMLDASGNFVSNDLTWTQLVNQKKQLAYMCQGSFNASGTEFYLVSYSGNTYSGWKISNISFNSGDNFIFQIKADLICQ